MTYSADHDAGTERVGGSHARLLLGFCSAARTRSRDTVHNTKPWQRVVDMGVDEITGVACAWG
jgi:hypothetical protein